MTNEIIIENYVFVPIIERFTLRGKIMKLVLVTFTAILMDLNLLAII